MVQPRSVVAQIQSPYVILGKPFLLSIHASKHRVKHLSPDASKVSETVIIFTSVDSLSCQSGCSPGLLHIQSHVVSLYIF